jgi:probable rRNA maturation factor
MNIIDIQRIFQSPNQPNDAQLELWVNTVLTNLNDDFELTIRIVDETESAQLNETYRHKQGATNILSFPFEVPEEVELNLLGDLVICASVLEREAQAQNKPLHNHWAHIVIHGTLHLLGYDHIQDEDAHDMEAKEIELLQTLSIPNPYETDTDL